jgi:hypothetical protein
MFEPDTGSIRPGRRARRRAAFARIATQRIHLSSAHWFNHCASHYRSSTAKVKLFFIVVLALCGSSGAASRLGGHGLVALIVIAQAGLGPRQTA